MGRLFPRKLSETHKLLIWSVFDYYGTGLTKREIPNVRNVALYLMKRKKGLPKLTEEQMSDLWAIKENLKDKLYIKSLVSDPPRLPV
jgi:hypothetical protein